MNRKEFCELLVKAKKDSGVRTVDLCSSSKLNRDAVNRIEKGVNNFDLKKALQYLVATKHIIKLRIQDGKSEDVTISRYSNFLTLFKKFKKIYTERELSALLECSHTTINRILQAKNVINIDTFLKLMTIMGYDVELEMQSTSSQPTFTETCFNSPEIINTKNVFEKLIQERGWHCSCPDIDFAISQRIENLYKRNELYLEDILKILETAGYTYDLHIFLPYGKTFDNFENAYSYTHLIYPPKPSLYQFLNMSEHDIKKANKHFGRSYVCTDMIYMYLLKVGCNISITWNVNNIKCSNDNIVYNMSTNDAFTELTTKPNWHERVGIPQLKSSNAKKLFKAGKLGLDSIYDYLYASGYVACVEITSQYGKISNNYFEALRDMLSLPDIISIVGDKQLYQNLYNKSTELWSTLKISTVHRHLESAGYQIIVKWGHNNFQQDRKTSLTYAEIPKSIFESNTEHVAINITKNIFSDLISTPKWYEKHPSLYREEAQHIKKKFLDNQIELDEMIDILVNSGYIYNLRITSPDSGTIFSDHLTAYNILSKIYNVHTILGIRNISDYMIKTGSDKHLSIDFILQFLIKVGCEIDIKWEIPEIVYV